MEISRAASNKMQSMSSKVKLGSQIFYVSQFQGISEAKAMLVLNHEEAPLDEKHCKEALKQPKPKTKTWDRGLCLKNVVIYLWLNA